MGRKGMKGFMKSAARPTNKPEEGEDEQSTPSSQAVATAASTAAALPAPKPAAVSAGPAAAVATACNESDDEESDNAKGETRSKMQQRHKKELLAHKKAVQRMGKKSKDELAKLDAEIEARHAKELQELDRAAAAATAAVAAATTAANGTSSSSAGTAQQTVTAAGSSADAGDKASKYLKELDLDEGPTDEGSGKGKKVTKAQRRREKAAAKDAEREARIAAERAELGPSASATEEASLQQLLTPLGLGIKEIRADGHCLYRSLEDQLQQTASNGSSTPQQQYHYQQLRELAADYIRQHKEQFAPFLLPEDEEADPDSYYEQYCDMLETTAAWGGHLELTALSAALQRQIRVHAVGMDTINLGETHCNEKPPLEICYLRHAFGLGEHYNSTSKLLLGAVGPDDEDDDQQEELADEVDE